MLLGSILLGWGAVGFMAAIPEPAMAVPDGPRPSIRHTLTAPFSDSNYRRLINFLFLWYFATHLAVPFFTVYMLTKLGLPLTAVVGLGVLSQIFSVLFLRVWGPMVDQFGSKAILSVSSSLFLLVIVRWTFTTMPDKYALTLPLLVILHLFMGIANAGINVSTTTMRMKLAPQSQATSYLTAASLAVSLGAGISPLLGGLFADFFSVRHFRVSLEWFDPTRALEFPAIYLTGFDFLFAVAFIVGLFTLNALARIREEGEADQQVVMHELMSQTRDNLRVLNSVPGLSLVSNFPFSYLRYVPNIPGLDVAVGVTAYQLAASKKTAVEGISRGGTAAADVGGRVSRAVLKTVGQVEDMRKLGTHIALNATRGALSAINDAGLGVERLTNEAVLGSLKALGKTAANPWDALWGAGYGSIQGANEAGVDLAEVATHAVEGARQAAPELGLSSEEAAARAAQGVLEAARSLGTEATDKVREAVLNVLIGTGLPKSLRGGSGQEEKQGG